MKKYLLFLFFISFVFIANAQKFSGQWKGGFLDKSISASSWGGEQSDYVLDLDINGDKVSGYSYTYFSTDGKKYFTICKIKGKLYKKSNYIEITETERTKTNIPQEIRNSFQLHKLKWSKQGKDEVLAGEWEPAPGQDRANTGYGTTKLTKRQLTEISALAKKKNSSPSISERLRPKTTLKPTDAVVYNKRSNKLETKVSQKINIGKTIPEKPKVNQSTSISKTKTISPVTANLAKTEGKPKAIENNILPKRLKQIDPSFQIRKNDVVQTINTETGMVKIELYDNGDIDGDSVSVFFNNEILLYHKRLTDQPLKLAIPIKEGEANELVMYADNLGTIPPNTALLIVTDGKKRYEVRITSDLEKSGAIRFVHGKKE